MSEIIGKVLVVRSLTFKSCTFLAGNLKRISFLSCALFPASSLQLCWVRGINNALTALFTPAVTPARPAANTAGQTENRFLFLDLVRGFSIIFMINLHIMMVLAESEGRNSTIGGLIMLAGTVPAAPVFMFTMGIMLAFDKGKTPLVFIRRGIILFIAGYILNAVRFLPIYMGLYFKVLEPAEILPQTWFTYLTHVDILQFAGLSIIFITVIRLLAKRPVFWLLTALLVGSTAPYLWGTGIGSDNVSVNLIMELLWGQGAHIYFPLFPWLSFPLFGMVFGHLMLTAKNRDRFFRDTFSAGLLIFLAGGMASLTNLNLHIGEYSANIGPGAVVMAAGFIITWISVSYWLAKGIEGTLIFRGLYFLSKHITMVYVAHWIIIIWIAGFVLSGESLSLINSIIMMPVVLLLSCGPALLWVKIKDAEDTTEDVAQDI